MHFSPIMARVKSDGGTRVIVDLSWPHANSVNSCVPANNFDFRTFQLKYPTIDHVVEKIRQYGSDALLYKVDLQKKTLLLIKAVKMHNPMKPKIKGVLSVAMLKQLMLHLVKDVNVVVFKAIYWLAFFGFFRLASLVPCHAKLFNSTRFPLVKDIVCTADGFQLILKCAKNMQNSDEFKIIHIPKLSCDTICPVIVIKTLIRELKLTANDPLFV